MKENVDLVNILICIMFGVRWFLLFKIYKNVILWGFFCFLSWGDIYVRVWL